MSAPAVVGTLTPLRITNLETGEALDLSVECSTEDAYHNLLNLRAFQKALASVGDLWEQRISADMDERGATERLVDGVLYEYKPGTTWVMDEAAMVDVLRELVSDGEITDAEFGEIVNYPPVKPSVHNGKLNSLLKRGAKVADAISRHRQQMPTAARLTLRGVR